MSMLTTQCDNLRLMARLVREYDYEEISRMLREAADIIEGLRDRAHELQHDITELRGIVEEYSTPARQSGKTPIVVQTFEWIDELECENDKLRELASDMWAMVNVEYPRGGFPDMGKFEKRIAELGIEVNA